MFPIQYLTLEAAFGAARQAVAQLIESDFAIPVVSIARPRKGDDEGGFLRLVAWCYVACYEVGRVFVPFFVQRSFGGASDDELTRCKDVLRRVDDMRTVSFHNIGFIDERDEAIRRRVEAWFVIVCGSLEPDNPAAFTKCFSCLAEDVSFVGKVIETAARSVSEADDRDEIVAELGKRLRRNLPAFVYDGYIAEAAAAMGVALDAKAFREQHLTNWRKTAMLLGDDAALHGIMRREVEAAVARYVSSRSPLEAAEWMRILGIGKGMSLGHAIRFSIQLMSEGITDVALVVERVREKYGAGSGV